MKQNVIYFLLSLSLLMVFSCKGKQSLTKDEMTDSVATAGPVFMEDSAYEY
ncbi:MAG: hypothetical protein HUK07_06290, partial [Bacteroidaceae bacterium]|nr:hypothetical protein [Bacteroidaceae bacterium]